MTTSSQTISPIASNERPAWRLDWLTPVRCRIILACVLGLGAISHVYYLNNNCPVDLSGDEAQYWDWSRQLDLSYYSKGPLVAYIIRASCAIFGDTMPAVRYPALILGVGTSVITYLLTRKLFRSERLALGAVLLFHLVPMFIAGSVLMTIDPPMFFCWALATYFAACAIFDGRRWMWVLVGIAIGLGFLAKYAEFLWFVGLAGFALFVSSPSHGTPGEVWGEGGSHGNLKKPSPYPSPGVPGEGMKCGVLVALATALVFTIPVVIWNARHKWVSFHHVAKQTGASEGGFSLMNPLEMVGVQFGAIGPTIAMFIVGGIVYAFIRSGRSDPNRSKLLLLMWVGLPFWILTFLTSFRAKIQPNWPAPSYFTLMILAAYFLSTRLRNAATWKPPDGSLFGQWLLALILRTLFYASIVIGLICIPVSHDSSVLFPIVRRIMGPKFDLKKVDLLARLRGYKGLGRFVSSQLALLPSGSFVLCHDYQQTAEMAFYVDGQPKTYCAGPYIENMRLSQYDMWSDRKLDQSSRLVGKDAIYVSRIPTFPDALAKAFDRIEPTENYPVTVNGVVVRGHGVWRCYGFKGLPLPDLAKRDY